VARICYLHVGTGKTGSSAVQWALTKERGELQRKGYLYPGAPKNFKRVLDGEPMAGNGVQIYRTLRDSDLQAAQGIIQRFDNRAQHIILSCEGLWRLPPPTLKQFGRVLRALGYETRCLVFFRPQHEFLVSSYLQHVKTQKTDDTLDGWVTRQMQNSGQPNWILNWSFRAKALANSFDHLTVEWYPAVKRGAGVVQTTFAWLGLSCPEFPKRVIINPTPGYEALIVLQSFNIVGRGNGKKFANKLLSKAQQNGLLGNQVCLGGDTLAQIQAVTHNQNAELLRRHCPGLSVDDELRPLIGPSKPRINTAIICALTGLALSQSP
jgi:hypothetical protein